MELDLARQVGAEVVAVLAPACEQIMVAGSVRRGKAQPKDIEIVYQPKRGRRPKDLFSEETYELTEPIIAEMLLDGVLRRDTEVVRWGPKYKRAIHVDSGAVIELFAATEENWGYILALRTGPGEFNKIWVRSVIQGGALPLGMTLINGHVWDRRDHSHTKVIQTPTEESFFAVLGLPCWPPEERTPGRLIDYLAERRGK